MKHTCNRKYSDSGAQLCLKGSSWAGGMQNSVVWSVLCSVDCGWLYPQCVAKLELRWLFWKGCTYIYIYIQDLFSLFFFGGGFSICDDSIVDDFTIHESPEARLHWSELPTYFVENQVMVRDGWSSFPWKQGQWWFEWKLMYNII